MAEDADKREIVYLTRARLGDVYEIYRAKNGSNNPAREGKLIATVYAAIETGTVIERTIPGKRKVSREITEGNPPLDVAKRLASGYALTNSLGDVINLVSN